MKLETKRKLLFRLTEAWQQSFPGQYGYFRVFTRPPIRYSPRYRGVRDTKRRVTVQIVHRMDTTDNAVYQSLKQFTKPFNQDFPHLHWQWW